MRPTITGKELDEMKGSVGQKFTAFSVIVGVLYLWFQTNRLTYALASCINIPQSVFTNWDHSISQALNSSLPMDEVSNMSDAESEIVDPFDLDNALGHNDNPNTAVSAQQPLNKGKAQIYLQPVLELIMDSEPGSYSYAM